MCVTAVSSQSPRVTCVFFKWCPLSSASMDASHFISRPWVLNELQAESPSAPPPLTCCNCPRMFKLLDAPPMWCCFFAASWTPCWMMDQTLCGLDGHGGVWTETCYWVNLVHMGCCYASMLGCGLIEGVHELFLFFLAMLCCFKKKFMCCPLLERSLHKPISPK